MTAPSTFKFSPATTTIEGAVYEAIGVASAAHSTLPPEHRTDYLMSIGDALINFIRHQTDNIGKLNESGIMVHEMFTSYVNAGFTEEQAMYLMGEIMKAMVTNR